MAYYNICSICGANLDPGERCDCKEEKKIIKDYWSKKIKVERGKKQLSFILENEEGELVKV